MFSAFVLIVISLFVFYKYFSRNVNYWKDRGVPGPKPLPLFGNLLDNFKTPINVLEKERMAKYGKVYGYLEMSQPVLTIGDNELIKLITIKDFDYFTNRTNLFEGDSFMSKILFSLQDDEWRRIRSITSSAFTFTKIRNMFDLVDQSVKNLISFYSKNSQAKKPINTIETSKAFTMDTIVTAAFGIETNSFKEKDNELLKHAKNIMDMRNLRPIIGYLLPAKIRTLTGFTFFAKTDTDYFRKILIHVIKERRANDSKHRDLLKTLIDAEFKEESTNLNDSLKLKTSERKLSDNEVCVQCVMFLLAAFETTSSLLGYLIYTLAMKPEIQNKLYEEVKDIFEKDEYNFNKLMSLTYLEAVINETLRMYPPVVSLDRVTKYDYILGDTGTTIQKGTVINIPFYAVHHNADYWPNPELFKPERFFPENKDKIKPYTFIPFGVGPRMCIGMKLALLEVKMAISKIVYNFKVLRTEKTPEKPIYNSKKISLLCEDIYILLRHRQELII